MKRILICTGILGGGTALTFAAAVAAATLMPGGSLVPVTNPNIMFGGKGGGVAVPVPMPANGTNFGGTIVTLPAQTIGPTVGP